MTRRQRNPIGTKLMSLDKEPGRVTVTPIEGDPEWWGYWVAYVGDVRVNGGLCKTKWQGRDRARAAISNYRAKRWVQTHIWDVETFAWLDKRELPDQD
jgi:hypothetical protein